jgi:arginase family enzyme
METIAVAFPFDLFGSAGAGAGAQLLADAVREMLADARRESQPARSHVYRDHVRLKELTFETLADLSSWRKQGRRAARQVLGRDAFLLWLAGNHLGVLPVLEELGGDSLVIQFDAHLDICNLDDCTEELSHGNFLLHGDGPLPAIVNVGHRDLFLPSDHVGARFKEALSAIDIASRPDHVVDRVKKLAQSARHLWVDIDCDVFDPAFFPATAHPLPFGMAPTFLLRLLDALWSPALCGMSISEFDPGRDRGDRSLGLLIWLVEWVLLRRYENPSPRR